MPFTFLAHQAPVLPLKLWRPRWFSGAGLAIGSMAPDFQKFVFGADAGRFGHTLAGQLLYCLPLSLAVYWLLTRVAAAPLARYAPGLGPLRLRDYAANLAAAPRAAWTTVALSVLVGSVSHVAFDGFTHGDPRVVALIPALRDRLVLVGGELRPLSFVLQVGTSVVAGAFTLALMYLLGRRRTALAWRGLDPAALPPPAPPGAAREFWLVVALLVVVASAAFALAGVGPAGSQGRHDPVPSVLLRLPLTGFLAACGAALVDRWRRRGPPAPNVAPRGVRGRRDPTPHYSSSRGRAG